MKIDFFGVIVVALLSLAAVYATNTLYNGIVVYSDAIKYSSDASLRFMERGRELGATEFRFERPQ